MYLKNVINALMNKDKRNNYTFTDEDRERSQAIKKAKHEAELNRIAFENKKAEMDMRKLELDFKEEYGSKNEGMKEILELVTPIIKSMQNGSKTPSAPVPASITEDDIRKFIEVQPKAYIKLAKKAPKSEVLAGVMMKFKLNEEQANKAYDILMSEF